MKGKKKKREKKKRCVDVSGVEEGEERERIKKIYMCHVSIPLIFNGKFDGGTKMKRNSCQNLKFRDQNQT